MVFGRDHQLLLTRSVFYLLCVYSSKIYFIYISMCCDIFGAGQARFPVFWPNRVCMGLKSYAIVSFFAAPRTRVYPKRETRSARERGRAEGTRHQFGAILSGSLQIMWQGQPGWRQAAVQAITPHATFHPDLTSQTNCFIISFLCC